MKEVPEELNRIADRVLAYRPESKSKTGGIVAFDYKHYVPILKGKRAEFPALGALKSTQNLTPLFEAVPKADLKEIPRKMGAHWSKGEQYFIDFVFLDDSDDEADADADYPLNVCFAEVAKRGQVAVPVTGLSRSQTYQSAVSQIVKGQKHGIAIRLAPDDFEEGADELEEALSALLNYCGVETGDADLLIDLGSVADSSAGLVAQMHRSNIDLIPWPDDWRTLTVVAGAFPLKMAPLTNGEWNEQGRHDWRGWRSLVTGKRPPSRLPSFGDYTIAHPGLPPTGRATIIAQLRYTLENSWTIWKGWNVFTHAEGFNQFFAICADLLGSGNFLGAGFSAGDAEIEEKVTKLDSPGNAESWRRIATNHHFEMVLDQIANLP
jgi:Beta protein